MSTPTLRYPHPKDLRAFLKDAESALLSPVERRHVTYPTDLASTWNADALASENEALLADLSGSANVYAIFTAADASDACALRYIGKTTRALARQRLRNHLFKKSAGTGAKLAEITDHIQSGGSVQIAWITIVPESMRNYVEEELISSHPEADWNRKSHNSTRRRPPGSR